MSADEILKLLRLAAAGGADRNWLRLKSAQLVDQALELEELRDAIGPKRLAAIRRRKRALSLKKQGVGASVIAECLSLSRARVYQLLDISAVSSGDEASEKVLSESKSM